MMMEETINYNDEPVHYCANCLSLRVIADDDIGDYCMDCGCAEIEQASIEDWEKKYYIKYGEKF